MRAYVDKVLDTTGGTTPITSDMLNDNLFSIGTEVDGGLKFTGDVDEIRRHIRELSGK